MTEAPEPSTFAAQAWANVPQIAALLAMLVIIIGVFTWLFGGFRPQSQIDIDEAKARITKLESALSSYGQTAQSDRAAVNSAIDAAKAIMSSRLDAMPRAKDFSDWEGHLSKLDGRADGFEHRLSDAEYNIRDLTNKYGALTTSPARK